MSLTEMIPVIALLPREEKLRLYELLAKDLTLPAIPGIPSDSRCEVWSACTNEAGAQQLLEFLQQQRTE